MAVKSTLKKSKTLKDLPILLFTNRKDWEVWLAKNQSKSPGLWLQIARKNADIASVSYDEALDVALCHGWIDGQKAGYDESSWLQKFTPRGPRSIWSKRNREKVEELTRRGQMKPSGLKAVKAAMENGRWEAAYDSQRTAELPEDFKKELKKNAEAKAFFATLNSVNRYAILFRIQTAKKPETRAKRIRQFIEMLERHEKIHN